MRQSWSAESRRKICVPICERTREGVIRAIPEASRMADLIELRVDYLKEPDLRAFLAKGGKPFIVTNRKKDEGGRYNGEETNRLRILREAVDLGTDYVDVEMSTEKSLLEGLLGNKKKSQVILSFHDFQGTPPERELHRLCDRMSRLAADITKIVTWARSWEDNFRVLSIIRCARKRKQKITAFCMGEKGKISRVLSPLMGGVWTYASMDHKRASAPGQLTVGELKILWEILR